MSLTFIVHIPARILFWAQLLSAYSIFCLFLPCFSKCLQFLTLTSFKGFWTTLLGSHSNDPASLICILCIGYFSLLWQNTWENNLKGKTILTNDFRGFSPWLLGSMFLVPLWDRNHGRENTWRRMVFILWQTRIREWGRELGSGITFKVMLPVFYFSHLGPTF
jgi:hypothetical protein